MIIAMVLYLPPATFLKSWADHLSDVKRILVGAIIHIKILWIIRIRS
jgi:hypothetical protein